MNAYFEYLKQLVTAIWHHIGWFFGHFFQNPWSRIPDNFAFYNDLLQAYSPNFGLLGWVLWVLFLVLVIALFVGIIYLIVILIRRILFGKQVKQKTKKVN